MAAQGPLCIVIKMFIRIKNYWKKKAIDKMK